MIWNSYHGRYRRGFASLRVVGRIMAPADLHFEPHEEVSLFVKKERGQRIQKLFLAGERINWKRKRYIQLNGVKYSQPNKV